MIRSTSPASPGKASIPATGRRTWKPTPETWAGASACSPTRTKAVAEAKLIERTVAHELLHHFRGLFAHGPEDEGILDSTKALTDPVDANVVFTDRQLALVRSDANPCDQS